VAEIETAQLAAIAGAIGAALVLLARDRTWLLAGFAALAVGEAALVASLAVERVVAPVTIALGAAALLVLTAGAALLVRRPELTTPALLAAAPFRLPLDFGREHRFFVAVADPGQLGRLLPLYVVVAAAAGALLWRAVRGAPVRAVPAIVAVPAAGFLTWAAVSLFWTEDLHAGTTVLAYFLLPFAALVTVAARAPFPPWLPRVLAWIAVTLAVALALIGLVQAATNTLLFYAPNLEVSNSYSTYFRVTSLFRDPSIFGRHLVLGITVLLVALWLRRVHVWLAIGLAAVCWAGLFFTYSQSSFVALFAVTLAVTALAGSRRTRLFVLVGALVAALVGAGLVAAAVKDESAKRATSDRSRRVEVAAEVYADRPLVGVGLGAQPLVSQRLAEQRGPLPRFVSHTTPLTVAAELGTVGLALYAALLLAALLLVARVYRLDQGLGLALAGVLVALWVHSLFYSGFFEDPITWFALAVAAGRVTAARA
jgi:O-antigen ligase